MLPKRKGGYGIRPYNIVEIYFVFFGGSKPTPYVMKLFSPLKLQRRS